MTLLVLELKLPALPHHLNNAQLQDAIVGLLPKGLTWLFSFYLIALFWLAQQRLYRFCRTVDMPLGWLELLQLSLISLFPFSNALMAEYGGHGTAAVFYAGHLLCIALASWARTAYFVRHPGLHAADMPASAPQALRRRAWLLTGCASVAVLLGFVAPGLNMLAMLPTLLLSRVARV